jgi:Raf kinase inhibitor-like YbhB/YbcL family protein
MKLPGLAGARRGAQYLLASLVMLCPAVLAGGGFRLTGATWHEGGLVPQESAYDRSGCRGGNLSPELNWSGAPADAKSFAISIFDADTAKPGGWSHWIMFNIPGNMVRLAAGAGTPGSRGKPAGALECINDYGTRGYGGPCPPPGSVHRYILSLYALKVEKLPIGQDAPPAKAVKQIEADALAVARMTVRYGD